MLAVAADEPDFLLPDDEKAPRPGLAFRNDLPLPKRVRNIPFHLTKRQSERLHATFPGLHFKPGLRSTTHSHPVLALERNECEAEVIDLLLRGNNDVVCDIGGAPNRHLAAGRARVHSVCPILSPDDVIRHAGRRPGPHYCECDALGCNHLPNCHVLLFVHSIYYFTPAQVLALLLRSIHGKCVSIHHCFEDGIGTFGLGEAAYELRGTQSEPVIAMTLGHKTYRHPFPSWMRTRYFSSGGYAMTWATRVIRGDTHIVDFQLCPQFPEWVDEPPVTFQAALGDGSAIGFVNLAGALTERPGAFTAFVKHQVDEHMSCWVFGPRVVFYSGTRTILVPRPLVDEVAAFCAGMGRTPPTYQTVLSTTRNKAKLYNIPPCYLADTIIYCGTLGYLKNMATELGVMNTFLAPLVPLAAVHAEALQFRFPLVVGARSIDAFKAVATAGLGWYAVKPLRLPTILLSEHTFNMIHPGSYTGDFVRSLLRIVGWLFPGSHAQVLRVLLCAVAVVYMWRKQLNNYVPTFNSLQYYDQRIASVAPTPQSECLRDIVLPAFTSQLPLVEPRPDSIMTPPDLYDAHPVSHRKVLSLPGIAVAGFVPTVMAQNVRNQMSAINNRMLAPAPYDNAQMLRFRSWVLANMDHLFPHSEEHRATHPTAFEEWSERFPYHTRLNLIRAKARLETSALTDNMIFKRGMFVKVEKGKPATETGGEDYDPRGIQSATDEYNVLVGPFIHAVSKVIKKMWNQNHFLIYTSGMSAEALGALFATMRREIPRMCVIEDDASRWDKSMGSPHLDLCIEIMRHFGSDDLPGWGQYRNLTEVLRRGMRASGHSSLEVFYKLLAMMKSGDAFTSLWNSLVNALMHCYIYCIVTGISVADVARANTSRISVTEALAARDALFPPPAEDEDKKMVPLGVAFQPRHVRFAHDVGLGLIPDERSQDEKKREGKLPDVWPFVCAAHGDDMLAFFTEGSITAAQVVDIAKQLGFTAKAKLRTAEQDYLVEFCSGVFWPVERGQYVLGPKPGRILSRLGWAVELRPSKEQKKKAEDPGPAFVRGVCLGLVNDVQHVPIAKELVNRMLQLTEGKRPMYSGRDFDYKVHASRAHGYCDDTLRFFTQRYGLGLETLESFIVQVAETNLSELAHMAYLAPVMEIDLGSVSERIGLWNAIKTVGPVQVFAEMLFKRFPAQWARVHNVFFEGLNALLDPVADAYAKSGIITLPQVVETEPERIAMHTLSSLPDVIYTVAGAPLLEEYLKHRFKWFTHVIVCLEWVGCGCNPVYFPTAVMHYICASLSYKNGVFVHGVWNSWVLLGSLLRRTIRGKLTPAPLALTA